MKYFEYENGFIYEGERVKAIKNGSDFILINQATSIHVKFSDIDNTIFHYLQFAASPEYFISKAVLPRDCFYRFSFKKALEVIEELKYEYKLEGSELVPVFQAVREEDEEWLIELFGELSEKYGIEFDCLDEIKPVFKKLLQDFLNEEENIVKAYKEFKRS